MTKHRFPLWTMFGVVLVVALVLGSGIVSSSAPTPSQRASAIESVVRCPTCEDLSVAQSTAPTAVTVRATVTQLIAEGQSDQQIKDFLVARYGGSIVLDPPASGWSLLVWLLPLVGGVIAVVVVATVLFRRRRITTTRPTDGPGERGLPLEVVEERRRFLSQSLADADAEYLAGDLSDKDYLALRQRDMLRLAALDPAPAPAPAMAEATPRVGAVRASAAIDEREEPSLEVPLSDPLPTGEPTAAGRHRSRKSWWFLTGAVVAFGAALVVAVTMFASSRAPGQSATGSFTETAQQQIEETLAEAATQENQGDLGQAAQLYQSVLAKHPDNEVAVAQLGWLEYETGQSGKSTSLITDARAKLNRAVRLDPGDYAARLYLGTLLLRQDGNAAGAVTQYLRFLADSPPAVIVKQAAPELRQAFNQAGVTLPAAVPKA